MSKRWGRLVDGFDHWLHLHAYWIPNWARDPFCDYAEHLITAIPYRRIRAETRGFRRERP